MSDLKPGQVIKFPDCEEFKDYNPDYLNKRMTVIRVDKLNDDTYYGVRYIIVTKLSDDFPSRMINFNNEESFPMSNDRYDAILKYNKQYTIKNHLPKWW